MYSYRPGRFVSFVHRAATVVITAACLWPGFAFAQFVVPTPIAPDLIDKPPYSYNGAVSVRTFIFGGNASGSLIQPRVFLTAAHVLYNANNLSWFEEVTFRLRQNNNKLQDNPVLAAGSFTFTSYSSAVQQSKPGLIPWHFNQDIGAVFTTHDISEHYGSFEVMTSDEAPLILGLGKKLVLGYPLESEHIPPENMFLLHKLQGSFEFSYWLKHADAQYRATDPDGRPHSTFAAQGWRSYPGASGGPIYVQDPLDGRWVQTGVVITGSERDGEAFGVVRAIDESSYEFIEKALESSGDSRPAWIRELRAESVIGGIRIDWDMRAETGQWQISRREGDGWILVATVAASEASFIDWSARPGVSARYRIRFNDGANYGPWSRSVSVLESGGAAEIGGAIGAPELHWRSGGHAPFFIDESGVRSAILGSEERSWISTTIEGPGVFSFSCSVSCEPGEKGDIYDSFSVYLDGKRVLFMDGEQGPLVREVAIPEGVHEILFQYAKDLYVQEGEDLARVHWANYVPLTPLSPINGSYSLSDDGWRYSNWLGTFFQSGDSWIFRPELGWMFAMGDGGGGAYLYLVGAEMGWIWTSAAAYPWVYSFTHRRWLVYLEEPSQGWYSQ